MKVLFLTLLLLALSHQRSPPGILCPQGNLPFGSQCKPITYIEGCASYHSYGDCKICEYGYSLTQGKCSPKTNETADCCASYASDGTCVQCSNGLFPSDPYCYRNEIYGCILKNKNKCQVCGYGLVLSNGICISPIAECSAYNSRGECSACNSHLQLINGYCYAFPQVSHCKAHNEYGCYECQPGFFLTATRQCQQYEPGCLLHWRQKCVSCLPFFELSKGKCFIRGCHVYSQEGCTQCHNGYTLVNKKCEYKGCTRVINNTCVECQTGLRLSSQGCVQEINYECTSCTQGYQFINGACVRMIHGCIKYTAGNQCAECSAPFKLTINGECQILGCQKYSSIGCLNCFIPFQLQNNQCFISHCVKYVSDGCSTCQNGYLLANKHCHAKDPNCLQYDFVNGKPICTSCANQYYLFQNQCKPAEKGCTYDPQGNCQCTSPFVNRNGKCEIVGCESYNWETCLACYAPFQYNSQSQTCVIPYCRTYIWQGCNNCEKGWLVNNYVCMKGDPYCISYDSQGNCQACKKGFIFSGSKCVKNIPGCVDFSQDGLSCLQCNNGYTLHQGYCHQVSANCRTMDFTNGICTVCNSGYYLINGQCSSNDPNCQTYSSHPTQPNTEICSQCVNGYFYDPNTNKCVTQKPGCVYQGSNCVSCNSPFLYDQQGFCYIPGCQQYSSSGCTNCPAPFKLVNSNCVIDFCAIYTKNGCEKCEQGYIMTSQGYCAKVNPNCLQYQGSECVQCKSQFTLVKGNCVIQDPNCLMYDPNGVVCLKCNMNYHPDPNGRCQPDEPGCIYQNGVCSSCSPPFSYNAQYKVCEIPNCLQADNTGCVTCKAPFLLTAGMTCELSNCLRWDYNGCIQCKPMYHLKNGACIADSPNCMMYSLDGVCELCADSYVVSANGECVKGSKACTTYSKKDRTKCLQCSTGYFLNRFYQCEKEDGKCIAYTNGVCSKCQDKFFLYSDICFPYTKGCVQYSGKDCTHCRVNYVLKNGECFHWNGNGLGLLGGNDVYDFAINPIDVRQSKYYIQNLSPASAIGSYYFSSYKSKQFQDCSLSTLEGAISKGWKAAVADNNQYIGVTLTGEPATFYALQLEAVDASYITQFYLEYSVDGTKFIRVQNYFTVPSSVANNMTTIYFTGLYAKSIRIKISGYHGWPAARLQFFYYDMIRFRKISNLKSLTYLQETINSNFVDRVDNQIYINQVYFFDPAASCSTQEMCFTGLQLCAPKNITELALTFTDPASYVTEFYLTYSVDGRNYNCYKNCMSFKVTQNSSNNFRMKLDGLTAQGVRVYPKNYVGSAKFSPTFYYN